MRPAPALATRWEDKGVTRGIKAREVGCGGAQSCHDAECMMIGEGRHRWSAASIGAHTFWVCRCVCVCVFRCGLLCMCVCVSVYEGKAWPVVLRIQEVHRGGLALTIRDVRVDDKQRRTAACCAVVP